MFCNRNISSFLGWFVLTLSVLCVVGCGNGKVNDLEPKSYTALSRIPVYESIKSKSKLGDIPTGASITVTGVAEKRCSKPQQTRFRINTERFGNGLFVCISFADVAL